MEHKKIFLIVTSVVIITIISVFVVYKQRSGQVTATFVMTELQLQQQVADFIKTKDFAQCDKVRSEMYKTVCINNIALNAALETRDISYCEKLDNKLVSRVDCERNVVLSKSIEKEDITVCGEATTRDVQKECGNHFYLSLAQKKNDANICMQASDKQMADLCHDIYLINTDFVRNPTIFDCSLLKVSGAQEYCRGLQSSNKFSKEGAISPVSGSININKCLPFKTQLFLRWCI